MSIGVHFDPRSASKIWRPVAIIRARRALAWIEASALDLRHDRVMRATLALEDRRFFEHPGVDPLAILRAAWGNLRGDHRSGASTIAMQVARMQHPAARNLGSKILEAGVAVALTWRYGHDAVLLHYLRLAPFGNGSHGIVHAARFCFDKPLGDLSWAEIALLSAIPQSPTRMNPLHPNGLARAVRRGQEILDELARQQVINTAELALAHRQLAAMRLPDPPRRAEALHVVLRYEAMAREGRLQPANVFDPRIRTTFDLDAQKEVTRLAHSFLAAWRGLGASLSSSSSAARERSSPILAPTTTATRAQAPSTSAARRARPAAR